MDGKLRSDVFDDDDDGGGGGGGGYGSSSGFSNGWLQHSKETRSLIILIFVVTCIMIF